MPSLQDGGLFCVGLSPGFTRGYFHGLPKGTPDELDEVRAAKEAVGKSSFCADLRARCPQGLKPNVGLIGFIGTTEVVPFQSKWQFLPRLGGLR